MNRSNSYRDSDSNEPRESRDSYGQGGRRYFALPKVCQFCTSPSTAIDYKQVELLKRFTLEDGKIRPRRQTGNCSKHQREIAQAIKRARHLALLPFTGEIYR